MADQDSAGKQGGGTEEVEKLRTQAETGGGRHGSPAQRRHGHRWQGNRVNG